MTNTRDYAPIGYDCNGATVDFPFRWKILEKESVVVTLIADGVEKILELGVDYTVDFDTSGGNVKTKKAYDAGNKIVIARNASLYQGKTFSTSGGFQSSEIEKAFDGVSINLQDMDYNIKNFKETFSTEINTRLDDYQKNTDEKIASNKAETDKQIESNKQEILGIQSDFEGEVNTKIQQVSDAAEKINKLEGAVSTALDAANTATAKAESAANDAVNAKDEAEKATEQATIATEQANKIKENVDDSLLALEATTQEEIKKIKQTGFYMQDNKLYYVTSQGETKEFKTGSTLPLLTSLWSDHIINDIQWLRSDTYSWQDGNVYQAVYNKLVEELGEKKQCYAYFQDNHRFWLESETPQVGDAVLGYGTTEHKVKCGTVTAVGDGYVQLSTITNSWNGTSWTPSGNYTRTPDEDKSWYIQEMELTDGTPICYTVSPSGFKIADSSKERAILNKYNSSGIAWYYILDVTNKRFKLPRTKYGFKGLRNSVGNDIAESLPNIKGATERLQIVDNEITTSGAFSSSKLADKHLSNSGTYGIAGKLTLDASLYSSTYQDNAPVQERGTQMYLYFYVGEYTQTAIEQTAGLNAELFNGKVDTNCANISAIGAKRFDGQWINNHTIIFEVTKFDPGTTHEYDLSSILPNDGYNYEVLLACYGRTGNTSGNSAGSGVSSSIITDLLRFGRAVTRTSSSVAYSGTVLLPVGTDRKIIYKITDTNATTGDSGLSIQGYRRLGTNG